MRSFRLFTAPSRVALLAAALAGCMRDTGDAGVKAIGVGYDPGDLFIGPEERGGIIDLVLAQMRGTHMDLGITGFFNTTGAFTDPESDPFDSILGFSYFFSPAINGADEYPLVSPKGPDVPESCFVQVSPGGPLGSFDTVDVGEELFFTNGAADQAERTAFTMPRTPQDYPSNTTEVFVYYIGTGVYRAPSATSGGNWAFGEPVTMHFDGGVPPDGAPVPSIPFSSDSADERVGKEAGDPTIFAPAELLGVRLGNLASGEGARPMRYAPTEQGLPSPLEGDSVLHVTWDEPAAVPESGDAPMVTVAIKLLRAATDGTAPEGATRCVPAEAPEVPAGGRDDLWLTDYTQVKGAWCDTAFEPDLGIGNDESGLDYLSSSDTCHDGLDSDGDGTCDEGGCEQDGQWLFPDPDCSRHQYETSACGSDGYCRPVGGDRGGDGLIGQLVCSADDDGEFVVSQEEIADLVTAAAGQAVAGAVVVVTRTNETLITVPMVRDQLGNQEDINPVRLRVSQAQYGRLLW